MIEEAPMKIKQSVCFPMMEPLPVPLPDFFQRVAQMGFDAVEIWRPDENFPELANLAAKHGLHIASFSGHDSIAEGLNDPAQHERICDELQHSIDLAARYQVPGVICFSGNRREGQSEEEAIEACAIGFRKIAPYAEKKGVNLNMELLNSIVDHPGYQCDHASWGLAVVKRVNSPRVKLLYDIYHMQIMEGNLIRTLVDNIQWIGHFHIAGVPGRNQIDDTQEINYRGLCKALAAIPYDLFIGHEYHTTRDLFETLKEAYAICDQE
jgi:hydroxypyruvate isomerase